MSSPVTHFYDQPHWEREVALTNQVPIPAICGVETPPNPGHRHCPDCTARRVMPPPDTSQADSPEVSPVNDALFDRLDQAIRRVEWIAGQPSLHQLTPANEAAYRERYAAILALKAKGLSDRRIAAHYGRDRNWAYAIVRAGRRRWPDLRA